tara:strand:+ start:76 stop:441 length:366 start_codon:yes stop_codon:yes gene_type:complete
MKKRIIITEKQARKVIKLVEQRHGFDPIPCEEWLDGSPQQIGCCDKCKSGNPGVNCSPYCECCEDEIGNQDVQVECHKCENGYPIGNMFTGTCPQGWTLSTQFNPKDCKTGTAPTIGVSQS